MHAKRPHEARPTARRDWDILCPTHIRRTRDGFATATPTDPIFKIFAPKDADFQQLGGVSLFQKDLSTQIFSKIFFLKKKSALGPYFGPILRKLHWFRFCSKWAQSMRHEPERKRPSPNDVAQNHGLASRGAKLKFWFPNLGHIFKMVLELREFEISECHVRRYLLSPFLGVWGSAPKRLYSCAVGQILSDPDEKNIFACALPSRFVWKKKFPKIFKN